MVYITSIKRPRERELAVLIGWISGARPAGNWSEPRDELTSSLGLLCAIRARFRTFFYNFFDKLNYTRI